MANTVDEQHMTSIRSRRAATVRLVVASATAGAVSAGVSCAALGGAVGGLAGAAAGFIPALFTFGLSIPLGAVVGTGIGASTGLAAGCSVGAMGGGAASYLGQKHSGDLRSVLAAWQRRALVAGERLREQVDVALDVVEELAMKLVAHRMKRKAEKMKEADMSQPGTATAPEAEIGSAAVELAKATVVVAAESAKQTTAGIKSAAQRTAKELVSNATETASATTALAKSNVTQAASAAQRAVTDPQNQMAAASAMGGAVSLGASGGAAGMAAGGAVGATVGLLAAPLTLGLSIPLGAAIGGGSGLCAGAATGSAAGFVGGGLAGYEVYGHKQELRSAVESAKVNVHGSLETLRERSFASASSVGHLGATMLRGANTRLTGLVKRGA